MGKWKSSAVALALALGGFWLVAVKDPAPSNAAGPSVVFSTSNLEIPTNLPTAEGGNAH